MQVGGVATHDVYRISGRVLINGVDVGASVESISIDRDIPSGLPGGGGFRSASGTITATVGDDVEVRPPTPWSRRNNWPPKPMDRVEIVLSDGSGREWTQFKGAVKDPSGTATSRTVTFSIQDNYQPLNREVTLPALSNSIPHPVDGNRSRFIGLYTTWIVDSVLRQAGRYATPPRAIGDVVGATFQGSTYPERGYIETSLRQEADPGVVAFPSWEVTKYGLAVRNTSTTYAPQIWSGTPGGGRITNVPVELTQELVDTEDATFLRARFGNGGRVALTHTSTHVRAVYYTPGGTGDILLSAPKAGKVRVTARFWMSGNTLNVEVRTLSESGEVIREGTAQRGVADALQGVIDNVWANGVGTQGAFQVAFVEEPHAWATLQSRPNAVIHAARFGKNHLDALPTQVRVPAVDLLNDISDAESASWWIDEQDVLHWWDRGQLAQQDVVATLTSKDHLKSLPWEYESGAARHRISVNYSATESSASWRTSLILYQGSGATLEEGDAEDFFIKTPNDEVWFGVSDEDAISYTSSASWIRGMNKGWRSLIGGVAVNNDGDERTTNSIAASLRRVTDATWVHSVRVTALGPDEQVRLRLPSEYDTDPQVWSTWRNENLPIVRGKKRVVFGEEQVTSDIRGPEGAPDYTHDHGWWIQDPTYAGQTADYLAGSLAAPGPKIGEMGIMPVLNLQVGDHIEIQDPEVMGLSITGVVTSNSLSADLGAGTVDQAISLMPTNVRSVTHRWADFGVARRGDSWAEFGADRAGDTWDDFGDNPLT